MRALLIATVLLGSGMPEAFSKDKAANELWTKAREIIRDQYAEPLRVRDSVSGLLNIMQLEGMGKAQVLDGIKGEESVYLPHLYLSWAYFRLGQFEDASDALKKCKDLQFMKAQGLQEEARWFEKLSDVLLQILGAEEGLRRAKETRYQSCLSQGSGSVKSLETEQGKLVRRGTRWTIASLLSVDVEGMKSSLKGLRETFKSCAEDDGGETIASLLAEIEGYQRCLDQKDVGRIASESDRAGVERVLGEYRALPRDLLNQPGTAQKWNERLESFCGLVVKLATLRGEETRKRLTRMKESQPGFFREGRFGGRSLEDWRRQLESSLEPSTSEEKASFVSTVIEAVKSADAAESAVKDRLEELKETARRYLEEGPDALSDEDQCILARSNRLDSWRRSRTRMQAAAGRNSIEQLKDATESFADDMAALRSGQRSIRSLAEQAAERARSSLDKIIKDNLDIPGCANPAGRRDELAKLRDQGLYCSLSRESEAVTNACQDRLAGRQEEPARPPAKTDAQVAGRIASTLERVDGWLALDGRVPREVGLEPLRATRKTLADLNRSSAVSSTDSEQACGRADDQMDEVQGELEEAVRRAMESRKRWLDEGCWNDAASPSGGELNSDDWPDSIDLSNESAAGAERLLDLHDRIAREEARAALACAFRRFYREGDPQGSIQVLEGLSSAETMLKASPVLGLSMSFFHWVTAQSMEEGEGRREWLGKAREHLASLSRGADLNPDRLASLLPPDFMAWVDAESR